MTRFVRKRGEEGATLILVIGFMVVVGLVSAGLVVQLASTSRTRVALDVARNREYDADAAILTYIPQVRGYMQSNPLAPCSASPGSTHNTITQNPGLNGFPVQVDCDFSGASVTLSGFVQRNVRFTASCAPPGNATCPAGQVIIQAQVNYASPNSLVDTTITVSKTYVQSWSVKS